METMPSFFTWMQSICTDLSSSRLLRLPGVVILYCALFSTRLYGSDVVADFSTNANPNGVWSYGGHQRQCPIPTHADRLDRHSRGRRRLVEWLESS